MTIDEVQKIPAIMDVAQYLIDNKIANLILTGSSARKLIKSPHRNLLPGRVIQCRLDPLSLSEIKKDDPVIEALLNYGSLPGIYTLSNPAHQNAELRSYVTTFLEEEIRAEALVRNVPSFSRFLELAAAEAGKIINFSQLSQQIGVAHTTIMEYYQILEDCLVAERISPYTQSATRAKLTRAPKYLFFDLGVRRAAAQEGRKPPLSVMGMLFEQWVGMELLRLIRPMNQPVHLRFWRDPSGPEVDWLLESDNQLIPIEVKWTDTPGHQDMKHLKLFLNEYPQAKKGYVICRTATPLKLSEKILAIPWQMLDETISRHFR